MKVLAILSLALLCLTCGCTRPSANGKGQTCSNLGTALSLTVEQDPGNRNLNLVAGTSKSEELAAIKLSQCIRTDSDATDAANQQLQVIAFYVAAAEHAASAGEMRRARQLIKTAQFEMKRIDVSKLDQSSAEVLRGLQQSARNDARGNWEKLL